MFLIFGAIPGAFGSEVPTPEFLAAALKAQEAACGRSLEVNYTYGDIEDTGRGFRIRYVRTPDVLFIASRQEKTGHSIKARYDRNECVLSELQEASKGAPSGLVSNKLDGVALLTNLPMDHIRFGVGGGKLCDSVLKGTVSKTMESIDGAQCWRVDMNQDTAWLDPSLGFSPRRIEIQRGDLRTVDEFKDFRAIADGAWFPMRIDLTLPQDKVTYHYRYTALDVAVDKPFASEDLQVLFPSGAEVRDEARRMMYTAP